MMMFKNMKIVVIMLKSFGSVIMLTKYNSNNKNKTLFSIAAFKVTRCLMKHISIQSRAANDRELKQNRIQ